ncbi:tetratricopeptide repeat protein [Ktedonobacter robiniae]|uniref:tetratricopeptide repeat protein n=1 Tax=Ktedonobacter robiniae TaxID=2778365 RepID=UPI0019169C96|nr:tetratricopeptide repeat protein [Ktedonobacter robiniae]
MENHQNKTTEQLFPLPSPSGKLDGASLPGLPLPLTRLLGRAQEVEEGERLLHNTQVRLLTVTGTGGVGKTRVALAIAAQVQHDFSDGVYLFNLAPVQDASFVLPTLLEAFSFQQKSAHPPLEELIISLRTRHLLLVLDNFEQVIGASPLLVELLTSCPALKVVVTSRERLHVRGEHELELQPLALPGPQMPVGPEALAQYGAIALFVERAQATLPSFQMTAENAPLVIAICQRLDGLPLALELAAARLGVLSLHALHQRLTRRLTLLTNGPRDLPARQQTLRATLQWSYDLLTPLEQRTYRRLSAFVGGCTLPILAAISAWPESETATLEDTATSLLGKHLLVRREQEHDEPRFVMLETVREFGWEQLVVCQEAEMVRAAQARYFVQLAEAAASSSGSEQENWFERLEWERENLRMTLQWLVEHAEQEHNAEMALRLAGAIARFWTVRWYRWSSSQERDWVERTLGLSVEVSPKIKARALQAAAWLALVQDDGEQAERFYQESLRCFGEAEDARGSAMASYWLGYLAWVVHQDGKQAQSLLAQCSRLTKDDPTVLALARITAGNIALDQGEFTEAQTCLEQSVALCRMTKQKKNLARALRSMGRLRFAQGETRDAHSLFEESLALCRETKEAFHQARALDLLGQLELEQGNAELAQPWLEEARRSYHALGTQRHLAWASLRLAEAARQQEKYEVAHACYRKSLELFERLNETEGIASVLRSWGQLAARQHKLQWAVRLWGASQVWSQRKTLPHFSLPVDHLQPTGANNEPVVAAVRQQLGPQTFTAAWEEGQGMSPARFLASQALHEPVASQSPTPLRREVGPSHLTEREIEVLRLVARGHTDAQIAEVLVISPRTVHAHLRSIYSKLGLSSRFAAIRYALDAHLL